jgi:hypothetical protein
MFLREQERIFFGNRPNKFESLSVAAYFPTKPGRKRVFVQRVRKGVRALDLPMASPSSRRHPTILKR